MRSATALFLIIGGLALIVVMNTFFIVPQTHQAIVLRFRAPIGEPITSPGLHIKAPFIDNVVLLENRNLGFTLPQQSIVASDQERLEVAAFVRWRIVDPLRFYQAVQSEREQGGQTRLEYMAQSSLRRVLGGVNSNDIIRTRRAALMQAIEADVNRQSDEMGVRVIDVRIRQAELPQETRTSVFQRMRTERQQVAAELRAEGQEEALTIRAEADREVVVIRATAREQAERIRGEGDGQRTRIFANAYGRDAEFAAFYRSLQAYEQAIPAGTPMVIPPEGDFFRFMRNQSGAGR
ncbi:MAG: protease modulator HflC [Hyphomonadaceae bacterium]